MRSALYFLLESLCLALCPSVCHLFSIGKVLVSFLMRLIVVNMCFMFWSKIFYFTYDFLSCLEIVWGLHVRSSPFPPVSMLTATLHSNMLGTWRNVYKDFGWMTVHVEIGCKALWFWWMYDTFSYVGSLLKWFTIPEMCFMRQMVAYTLLTVKEMKK